MIQVLNMIYGGERFSWDGHQLVDNGDHLPGFLLDKSGMLKASGAEISGHIKAKSGELDAVTINEQAVFKGRIFSGNFTVDFDPNSFRRFPASGYYTIGSPQSIIRSAVVNFLGVTISNNIVFLIDNGEFNGERITAIRFDNTDEPRPNMLARRASNGIWAWVATGTTGNLMGNLWFQIGNGERSVRFQNLPVSPGAGAAGTVFRENQGDGTSILKIKN